MKKLTPAQQQYTELKRQHNDSLLLFRLGDFYELFYDDAKEAHKTLWITLTAKNKNSENPIPMAWIPYHSLQKYLPRLVKSWYKVAIAEQVWKVRPGKVVERKVVEIVTPWTYIEDWWDFRFVAWLTYNATYSYAYHLSWWDFSLGQYFTQSFENLEQVRQKLIEIWSLELVVDAQFPEISWCDVLKEHISWLYISLLDAPHDVSYFLQHQLQVTSLEWYGKSLQEWRSRSVALLFSYLTDTQKSDLSYIHSISYAWALDIMHLDWITIKNLEIFSSSYEQSVKYSLYWVIDTCSSSMWSRFLRQCLKEPLKNIESIRERQHLLTYFLEDDDIRHLLKRLLSGTPDLPRLLTSLVYKAPSALKVQSLMWVLSSLLVDAQFLDLLINKWNYDRSDVMKVQELSTFLLSAIADWSIRDTSWFIADWFDDEVDRVRHLVSHSDELLLSYQQELVSASWVTNVKIKFIKNQWYYIEITPKDVVQFEKIISSETNTFDLVRTQSLKTWQRYMSTYLSEVQNELLSAKETLQEREKELLVSLISRIESASPLLFKLADSLAYLDLFSSHAQMMLDEKWCLPEFNQQWVFEIQDARHPVVEAFLLSSQEFIPNDLYQHNDDFFHLVTWPNMWWKSTYLRQNALIVLLAHVWLWVPAKQAKVALVDWIFARVWSWDALAKNQSTFMTEMIEMANILHNATSSSFVVLDELWRWTSTYDWLALAKAIVVNMCRSIESKTLFATHYHELVELEWDLPGFSNWHVSVYESDDQPVFLKKIVAWWASKSYWLDVAQIAWIPSWVLSLAQEYLAELEFKKQGLVQTWFDFWMNAFVSWGIELSDDVQKELDVARSLLDEIQWLNLHELSPIELMNIIADFQKRFSK